MRWLSLRGGVAARTRTVLVGLEARSSLAGWETCAKCHDGAPQFLRLRQKGWAAASHVPGCACKHQKKHDEIP